MAATEQKLNELVNRLRDAAGANLQSVVLYGSAARGEVREGVSDLNVLCTLHSVSAEKLRDIAPVVSWWTLDQREPAPLFFTVEELRNSADVFVIELLDMQGSHQTVFGPEVLREIEVPRNLHRVQVERELRTAILKLRAHLLASYKNEAELSAVLAKSSSSILALLKHTLLALGSEVPAKPEDVFQKIGDISGAKSDALLGAYRLRESKSPAKDVLSLYGGYLAALEQTVSVLDKFLPKRQWQRSGAI